jgi:hypothetical protein
LQIFGLFTAKITEIRAPELTLLWSKGDAALSRVSPGEHWVSLEIVYAALTQNAVFQRSLMRVAPIWPVGFSHPGVWVNG